MTSKKVSSKKLAGPVRVLLVDEDVLAMHAWKKVLNNSKQIQVMGEIALRDLRSQKDSFEPPEILVVGNSFMEAGYLKAGILRSLWGVRPKGIVIADNKEQVKSAFKHGADFSASKPFNHQDLITWVRGLSDDAKRLCSEYWGRLSRIQAVPSQNRKYGDLIASILQLLFHPDLVNPEIAKISDLQISSRLVFQNQAREHTFWIDAGHAHKSKYITVDIGFGA